MKPDLQGMVRRLQESGMSQKAIADRLGCSQPTVSDIAAGKVGKKRPSYEMVSTLTQMLNEARDAEGAIARQEAG